MISDRDRKIGAYELLKLCGRGAYGEVFVARNTVTDELVALKILHPSPRTLERELNGLIRYHECRHPNLIRIWHVEHIKDSVYYTMDLADDLNAGEGEYLPATLSNRLDRQKRLPPQEVKKLADAMTDALRELHRNGLIHRDVKPDNILWIRGVPTLADAGLTAETRNPTLAGTPEFMPVEVLRRERPASPADDFHALSRVLYCAFTGEAPYEYPKCPQGLLNERTSALWRRILDSSGMADASETTAVVSKVFRLRYMIIAAILVFALLLSVAIWRSTRLTPQVVPAPRGAGDFRQTAPSILARFHDDDAEYEKLSAAARARRNDFNAAFANAGHRLLFLREFAHLSNADYVTARAELTDRYIRERQTGDPLMRLYFCQEDINTALTMQNIEGLHSAIRKRHDLLKLLEDDPGRRAFDFPGGDWKFETALDTEAPAYLWNEGDTNAKLRDFLEHKFPYRKHEEFTANIPAGSVRELQELIDDGDATISPEKRLLYALCKIHETVSVNYDWKRRHINCDEDSIRAIAELFRQNRYLVERLYREYPNWRP